MVEAPVGPGLSDAEAAARLASDGPNLLPGSEPAGLWRVLRSVLSEPMLLLLLGAGGVYLLIGDRREALTMLSFVVLIIGLSFLEERKTRRALEALRDLSSPRALVLRGGAEQRIPGGEVVRGDLLVLREGDRVPADAELRQGLLSVDESLLTGESVPLQKAPGDALFASTLVAKGLGWAEVLRTGPRTEVGRIGGALLESGPEATPLQRASRRMVRRIAALGGALALAATLLSWLWAGRGVLPSVLAGLTLAMAILPQEIPVVLSVFLAMGARRLSRQQVLTRRIPTVEALGAATVLAVDKTGTLTQNRMAVAGLCADGVFLPVEGIAEGAAEEAGAGEGAAELPEAFHALVEFSILATPPDPFDPMEQALQAFGRSALRGTEHLHDGWAPERAYDLSPGLLAMTQVYRLDTPDQRLLAAKGAPEAIVDLCHLDAAAAEAVGRDVEAMAARGLRVLGVARGTWRGGALPPEQHDFDFTFLGLVGLLDPPRPEVPEALATCRAAGIRVLMLTGDHPRTAEAIARRIGLPAGAALTGPELDGLDDEALAARLRGAAFCARMKPEQKLRLVRALMAAGEVVAMTGDGVNDAPALRAAHIGVAMGKRGTDVAREAADLVLLDDSFGSLVGAIREGRRIYDNLSRSVGFIFAVHVPVLGLALVPLALRWAPPLLPVHIALLEMLINPACSVVLEGEPAAPGLMDRPPRDAAATPFSGAALRGALLRGGGLLAVLLALQASAVRAGLDPATQRTRILLPLMLGSFLQILAYRRAGRGPLESLAAPNPRVAWTGLAVALFLAAAIAWPPLQRLLELAPPTAGDAAWGLAAALAFLGWLELMARTERVR